MVKAVNVTSLRKRSFNVLPFAGEFEASIGQPEVRGTWIVWGNSGNGKTSFALQLAKYLAKFGKVIYNSLEEGISLSMANAIERINMVQVNRNFWLIDGEPMDELNERLEKDRAIRFVIIDSLQYSGLGYDEYRKLRQKYPNKLFVFISHARGKEPAGSVAESIRFDAFVKIWVEGYRAFAQSRYGGGEPFEIWKTGASKYWTKN